MKVLAYISRFLLGIVFTFSGFVKAVDPWGSKFKFEDYFIALGLEWLMPASLVLAILLSTAEFIIGVAFLIGIKPKLSIWSSIAFMIFFTPLTLWLAITDAVTDCGCFGDAIVLTNWQTFFKNIAIIILLVPVFLYRKKFGHYMNCKLEWVVGVLFTVAIVGISIFGLRHLPIVDFLPYKPGLSLKPDTSVKVNYFVTYKNKITGVEKEYPADNYPWNDSIWMSENEFVSSRDDRQRAAEMISLENADFEDVTERIMLNPSYQFLVVSFDMGKISEKAAEKIRTLAADCDKNDIEIALLTATSPDKAEALRHEMQIPIDLYFADDIALKMLVRSNPGFLLMKDGMLLDKWAWRDLPMLADIDLKKLEDQYLIKK
ncbi:MAG: DoxX family protein [Bacteroidales bacterium]|jgi:uncharacterized membrane protein YphA (DoxX/SURF4 family)|nr:DoxX family protein [Bacteroidales bacterium]